MRIYITKYFTIPFDKISAAQSGDVCPAYLIMEWTFIHQVIKPGVVNKSWCYATLAQFYPTWSQ